MPVAHAETSAALDDPQEPEGPQTRLSPLRVLIALIVIAALTAGTWWWVRDSRTKAKESAVAAHESAAWFAPYVDTTLTPALQFQDPAVSPARQVILGFVVADPKSSCSPSWGGFYSLSGAADQLNLDRRIAQLQNEGASAVVSFGGQANNELAVSCTDATKLAAAYQSVISRYSLTTIDLDIEGAAQGDQASLVRRAQAIASVQKAARAAKSSLNVWLTLPVEPDGLQSDALNVVKAMLDNGVALAGVNVMAMDFTLNATAPQGMYAAITGALNGTHRQLTSLLRAEKLTSAQIWNRIGATVMIGQNDVAGQIVTVSDAKGVASFARAEHLGRVSMWSLNRDSQCGSQFARIGVHSNTCSGTSQTSLEFSKVLGSLTGSVSPNVPTPAASASPAQRENGNTVVDDPAHVPFPIWNPLASYPSGYKIVREGYVYQAKWYNTGVDPAAATQDSSAAPWQVVGPVLASDHPPVIPTLAAGTYPKWSPTVAYKQGQKVLRDGLGYQAKYYTQGDDPAEVLTNPSGSPWKALYTIPGEPAPTG
ncbi:MAG TPA: chitinase [Frankiaceae bacterium]|nr:chitinase [Frankiaceae bacterium]